MHVQAATGIEGGDGAASGADSRNHGSGATGGEAFLGFASLMQGRGCGQRFVDATKKTKSTWRPPRPTMELVGASATTALVAPSISLPTITTRHAAMDSLVAQYTRPTFAEEDPSPEEQQALGLASGPALSLGFALPPVAQVNSPALASPPQALCAAR